MKQLKMYYEVETAFKKENETITITTFRNEDPLQARKEAFDFVRNYINILKQENLISFNNSHANPRHQAQFKFDYRTKNYDHHLLTYFIGNIGFKDGNLSQDIKKE